MHKTMHHCWYFVQIQWDFRADNSIKIPLYHVVWRNLKVWYFYKHKNSALSSLCCCFFVSTFPALSTKSIIDCSAAKKWQLPNLNVYSLVCLQYVTFAIHYIVERQPSLRKTSCSLLQCIMKGCKWANLQLWQQQPQQRRAVIGFEVPLQRLLWWERCGWK